jgi:hypothetical protein
MTDGCVYASAKELNQYILIKLDAILKETRSLIKLDCFFFWTINDNTDKALYAINNKGVIQNKFNSKTLQTRLGRNFTRQPFTFILSFGTSGLAGKDLHILRIEKNFFHWE